MISQQLKNRTIAGLELSLMILSTFAFAFLLAPISSAASSEPSVCCEKTKSGAYCINTDEGKCNGGYKISQTSCETTSYCKLGTCYDSEEGICMENTPQTVCSQSGGTWDERDMSEVPQCQLGCCLIADQAAFVSLVRCKRLSSFFGVENSYNTDINSEIECIATAQAQDMGACVYEKEFERVCEFTTRGDCGASEDVKAINQTSSERKFYKDYLCSAEELNTICARQTSTTCYDGKVYWVDSCGNRENVYSANKERSWNNGKVTLPNSVCEPSDGTDADCGNCDYFLGTRCAEWDSFMGGPSFGENYCQKTECTDRYGNNRLNGESWCVYDGKVGNGTDMVGSRYFREICVDGEVVVEACEDYRNEVCIQSTSETSAGDYSFSACRVNRWHDCVLQTEEEDCLNIDQRDCQWLPPVTGMMINAGDTSSSGTSGFSNPTASGGTFTNPTANAIAPITGYASKDNKDETITTNPDGICTPSFSPGLEFWDDAEANEMCGLASAKCYVLYEKGLLEGDWDCVDNCECLEENWALSANRVCAAMGDCGGYTNYIGKYTDDGYDWKVDGDSKEFSPNNVNKISRGFSGIAGMVIAGITGRVTLYESLISQGYTESGGMLVKGGHSVNIAYAKGYTLGATAGTITTTQTTAKGTSWLSKQVLGTKATSASASGGAFASNVLVSALQWAAIAYGIGYMIGSLLGWSEDNTQALSTSLAAGAATYKALYMIAHKTSESAVTGLFASSAEGGFLGIGAMGWGLIVGAIIFVAMYKETDVEVVTFDCIPWQAPTGGNECEKCNDDSLPCSEYRCKSLGQNCELLNAGTGEEKCVNVNPRDVTPPTIYPNYDILTKGHEFADVVTSPPGPGFRILKSESTEGCLAAFTPLEFGITTNEPAQCKIDFNHTTSFDQMRSYVGGSNLFSYNHTEVFSLPSTAALKNSSLVLENGKDITFYLRCKDKNGNENSAEYAVNLCIDPSPDTTAPQIKATSVLNEGCVAENQDSVEVDFYTNEPANCRWDFEDTSYENMENEMRCSNKMYQVNADMLFTCRSELTGISRDGSKYYVRCEDQPTEDEQDRNRNVESYVFSLRGSTGLKIIKVAPNETIFGGTDPAKVELFVQTAFGCNNGQSICYYSTSGKDNDYVMFFQTNTADGISTQRQDLKAGKHKYYVKCVDAGGNLAEEKIEFDLEIDTNAPDVARVYEEQGNLKLITIRKSECAYSFNNCDFEFSEGTQMPYANSTIHIAEWNEDKIYYIKCRDEYKNEDSDCSIIVKPTDLI